MEQNTDSVRYSVRCAVLDVWIGSVASLIGLDDDGQLETSLLATGGRFLLTGKGVTDQCGRNDFCVEVDVSPGYSVIDTGHHGSFLHVCPFSHSYVLYHQMRKYVLANTLKMEEVDITPFSLFVGHGYVQHAGVGWRGGYNLRYHTYIAPVKNGLPDEIWFAYGASFARGDSSERMSGNSVSDTDSVDQEMGDEEEAPEEERVVAGTLPDYI